MISILYMSTFSMFLRGPLINAATEICISVKCKVVFVWLVHRNKTPINV